MPRSQPDTEASRAHRAGSFNFQLGAAEEERASRLHRESIVVDLLSQYAGGTIFAHYPEELRAAFEARMAQARPGFEALAEAMHWPFEMALSGKSDLLRAWFDQGGLTCGTYGIDIHDGCDPVLNRWEALTATYAQLPWLRCVTTAAEIRQAKREGLIALYAHCQPVHPLPRELQAIDTAYQKGLRSLMLTYNRMDFVGVGCTERVDAGLSMFGIELLQHCNDIGMIVDVSHCGHLTTLDACRHSRRPVNANHTAARAAYDHARGKSDEALRAIAETGGVIGVVAAPPFLTDSPTPSIEHMLNHIEHIADLVGWQHVALGTDWPLQAPDAVLKALEVEMSNAGFREQDRLDLTQRLAGFDDCRDLPNVTRGLVKRGYSDEQIQGILGENALRVFEAVCGA